MFGLTLAFVAGCIFYLVQQEILVIRWMWPMSQKLLVDSQKMMSHRDVRLYAWKAEKMQPALCTLLWSPDNHNENLSQLVGSWITYLQDEKLLSRYVTVEAVALSPLSGEAIISFSQSPLEVDWSMLRKWYFIESLCQTIREAHISASALILLVNNRQIEDNHLDLSRPWPLDGFLT